VPIVLSGTDKTHRVFNVAHSPIAVMLFLLEVSFALNISITVTLELKLNFCVDLCMFLDMLNLSASVFVELEKVL
jgi:hypothetical protein